MPSRRPSRSASRAPQAGSGSAKQELLFDAVFVAGARGERQWANEADAVDFVRDAFRHCKAVAATGEGVSLLEAAHIPIAQPDGRNPADAATIVAPKMLPAVAKRFIEVMGLHRLWKREPELHR
jgi:catalase